jgi:methylenetetrahydrofolate reductase (NADPH)
MTIRDRIAAPEPTLSYELFPPRTPDGREALCETITHLAETHPDFVSITYGASGSTRDSSREVVRRLAQEHTIPPLAHLTCVSASRQELVRTVEEFLEEGVRGFLALRGDPPQGESGWHPHPDGLLYASQLVALIREVADANGIEHTAMSIGVAVSPTTHVDERWKDQALEVLRAKQDAGADFAITQVFFQADHYLTLVEEAREAGISIPIVPGIIPLPNAARAARIEQLTGVVVPNALMEALTSANDEDTARAVGVAHSAALARAVLESGAPGVHVYTFNRHQAALELVAAVGLGS